MNPEVSVVIPVYNVEKYIRQCLDSIRNQTFQDYEAILVDDGSPDNCPAICEEYARLDKRFRVIHQKNAGVSAARNTGIEHAIGKWMYLVDSDDWIEADALEKLYNAAMEQDVDCVLTDCVERYSNGENRRLRMFSETFRSDDREVIDAVQKAVLCHKYSPHYSQGADNEYPAPWSKFFKTSIVMENGIRFDPYVGGVYDDGLFTLEILEVAQKIAYSGTCTYNYRILNSSIVHSFRKGMVEKFEKNCERVSEFAERNHKGSDFIQAEYARRIAYLSSFMSAYFFSPDNDKPAMERKAELKLCLNRSPWKEAIQNARFLDLENKHKYTLMCMKTHYLLGLKTYSDLKRKLK